VQKRYRKRLLKEEGRKGFLDASVRHAESFSQSIEEIASQKKLLASATLKFRAPTQDEDAHTRIRIR
jgi:hypothetical protein